jgi:chemotaxis protein CheD
MASARMGEMVVSAVSGDELVALGLGSCIGLALIDRAAGVAGLAHVVLPDSGSADGPAGKFADLAVPELLAQMRRAGAIERRLEAVLVGGARMFEMSGGLDIGSRNEKAVRSALTIARVQVRAATTGGNQGRTVRVIAGESVVTVKVAGGQTVTLFDGSKGEMDRPIRVTSAPTRSAGAPNAIAPKPRQPAGVRR